MKKITINMAGPEGNAFCIMGKVAKVLSKEVKDEYFKKATSSDYSNLLKVSEEYAT